MPVGEDARTETEDVVAQVPDRAIDTLDGRLEAPRDLRVGRTKVPYGYEYYKIAEGDLIGPERSVFVGNLSPNVELPLQEVVSREISVLGSCASNGEIPECIELLTQGVVDVAPIISMSAPLDQGPELFARLYRGDNTLMKVIIQP